MSDLNPPGLGEAARAEIQAQEDRLSAMGLSPKEDAPVWTQEDFDNAVQSSIYAADDAYFKALPTGVTAAEMGRIQVRAALESLIGNGLVKPVPSEQWDEWLAMQPPYPRQVVKS